MKGKGLDEEGGRSVLVLGAGRRRGLAEAPFAAATAASDHTMPSVERL